MALLVRMARMLIWIVVAVLAVMVGVVVIILTTMRVPVEVFTNSKRDEQATGNKTDWPTDLDSTEYRHRLVDLREIEVVFRVEEHPYHRNTANKVADADDETRGEPVHPLARLVERI